MVAIRVYPDGTSTVALALGDERVGVDATTGNVTVNLPSSASFSGRTVTIWLIGTASGHTATVTPFAGDTFGGASSYILDSAGDVVMATADGGTDWPGPIKSSSSDASAVAANLATHTALTSTAHSIGTQIAAEATARDTAIAAALVSSTALKRVTVNIPITTPTVGDHVSIFVPGAGTFLSMRPVIEGSTDVEWNISAGTSVASGQVDVFTSNKTTSNNTTGVDITSFDHATFVAGTWLKFRIEGVTDTPTAFNLAVTMSVQGGL